MSWFKLDDKFHDHPKVEAAGNAAIGLYCRLGTYCADKLTDGFIPTATARRYGTAREIKALTFCPIPDTRPLLLIVEGGYVMPDYLEYNPTREKVLAEREAAKLRMQGVRANKQSRSAERSGERAGGSSRSPVTRHPSGVTNSTQSSSQNTPWADDDRVQQAAKWYGAHQAFLKANDAPKRYAAVAAANAIAEATEELAEYLAEFPDATAEDIAMGVFRLTETDLWRVKKGAA